MNLDITSLIPDLEALTPDGRWNVLQHWLKENPEYGEKVDRWSQMSVDAVCDEITILVIGKYGGIAVFVMQTEVGKVIKEKVRRTIEILQACYRERAGEYKAEYSSGWMEPENNPRPSAHKSIHDYQQQLKAKKRRRKK